MKTTVLLIVLGVAAIFFCILIWNALFGENPYRSSHNISTYNDVLNIDKGDRLK